MWPSRDQAPRPGGGGLAVGDGDAHGPLEVGGVGAEQALHGAELAGWMHCLPLKPRRRPSRHSASRRRAASAAGPVGGAHEVDGRRQAVGARGGGHGAAGVQELGQHRRARQRHVEREVLRREDQAVERRRRRADLAQVDHGARRLDQRQQLDRPPGADVAQHVRHEPQVRRRFHLGHHHGVDERLRRSAVRSASASPDPTALMRTATSAIPAGRRARLSRCARSAPRAAGLAAAVTESSRSYVTLSAASVSDLASMRGDDAGTGSAVLAKPAD